MGFFSDSKDRLIESMALPLLNRSVLAPYGRATHLRINSTNRTAELVLELEGEQQPVQFQVTGYDLQQEGNRVFATLRGVRTSRPWLTTLVERYVLNRPFELPPQAAGVASKFL